MSNEENAMSSEESRTPEQIEAEIEATRSEMGETVAAVAEKADVKGQAKEKVEEAKDQAREKVEEAKGKVGEIKAQAPSAARENPVPVALAGAFIAGVVIGRISRRRR